MMEGRKRKKSKKKKKKERERGDKGNGMNWIRKGGKKEKES